jgi:hypothetical protein
LIDKWSGDIMIFHIIIMMERGRKQPQMKEPLLQPNPPHSPNALAPPSKPGNKGATLLTFFARERAIPNSTLSLPLCLSESLPLPTPPLGHREKKKEIKIPLSHQPKKKGVKSSLQNERRVHNNFGKGRKKVKIRPPLRLDLSHKRILPTKNKSSLLLRLGLPTQKLILPTLLPTLHEE